MMGHLCCTELATPMMIMFANAALSKLNASWGYPLHFALAVGTIGSTGTLISSLCELNSVQMGSPPGKPKTPGLRVVNLWEIQTLLGNLDCVQVQFDQAQPLRPLVLLEMVHKPNDIHPLTAQVLDAISTMVRDAITKRFPNILHLLYRARGPPGKVDWQANKEDFTQYFQGEVVPESKIKHTMKPGYSTKLRQSENWTTELLARDYSKAARLLSRPHAIVIPNPPSTEDFRAELSYFMRLTTVVKKLGSEFLDQRGIPASVGYGVDPSDKDLDDDASQATLQVDEIAMQNLENLGTPQKLDPAPPKSKYRDFQ